MTSTARQINQTQNSRAGRFLIDPERSMCDDDKILGSWKSEVKNRKRIDTVKILGDISEVNELKGINIRIRAGSLLIIQA